METVKTVHLTKEKETLFITLQRRANDCQAKHSLLHDTRALEIVNSVDYDFSKLERAKQNHTVIRAKQVDEWTRAFIAAHPNAVVVYLGCGLDTRVSRINPPASVDWYDVDYPEVMEVRKNFYADSAHYKMLAFSITDAAWLAQTPNDRPTLIMAEGVLEYLTAEDAKTLLLRLTERFAQGQMVFDVMSARAIKMSKKYSADKWGVKWGIDDTSEIEKWNPKLKKLNEISLFKSEYIKELSFRQRAVYKLMSAIPIWRNMMRLLRYAF